jgi:hypothetical protein
MMPNNQRPAVKLFGAVASIVLVLGSIVGFGGTEAPGEHREAAPAPKLAAGAENKPANAPAGHDAAKPDEKPDKNEVVLKVVVTGNGAPISGAEVKVKFPPSIGGEETRYTDDEGLATFKSPAVGSAKVRVIADGKKAVLKEVELKSGQQALPVETVSL